MQSNQEIITKIRAILSQKESEELEKDKIYKMKIKILFGLRDEGQYGQQPPQVQPAYQKEINFPAIENSHQILIKFVELINLIFEKKQSERNVLYQANICNIKEKNIISLIQELQELEIFKIQINNNELGQLFTILSNISDDKKLWTLSGYLDSMLLNISFQPKFKSLLKLEIYLLIINNYLRPYNIMLNFNEEEMNVEEEKSLKLIIALFQKTKIDDELLVLSIIILNYNSLTEIVKLIDSEKILSIIRDISPKIQNAKKSKLYVDKVLMIFSEEIQLQKIIKKQKKDPNIKININAIQEKQQVRSLSAVEEKNEIIINNSETKSNKDNISHQKEENDLSFIKNQDNANKSIISQLGDNYDDKNNIINLFNKIFNIINMGNDNLNADVNKLKNIMLNLVDKNEKMKEEVTNLKSRVDNLERDCNDMKNMFVIVQSRGFSRNFLSHFNHYLTDDDFSDIKARKISICDAIIKRVSEKYKEADRNKLLIVKNLIQKSNELLIQDDNFFPHSLTLETYEEEIEEYKRKNNLDKLPSPNKFCYLIRLGLYNDNFDESFTFLCRYFDENLVSKGNYDSLNEYFK